MAQLAGTTDTTVIKGQREDLMDKIFMLTPEDTPFMSNIGRSTAKAIRHEWQVDALAAPDGTNAQIEGDEFVYAQASPTTRVGNLCQISRKTILISNTAEAVDKAGRRSEMTYQAMKRGKELKKDMEKILLSNQTAVVRTSSTAGKLGGFPAWLTSNVSRGAGAVNGGYNTGTNLPTAYTAGTPRAWTETMLKDAMQAAYVNGGNPRMLMVSPKQKRVFSTFTGIAQYRKDVGSSNRVQIVGAADMYTSDFGSVSAVPNRVQQDADVFIIDPKMVKLSPLRRMQIVNPAQTGDAKKRVMITEYTLEVDNEAAHATISDLS